MPDPDALALIRATLKRARDLELAIKDTESKLSADKTELSSLQYAALPDLFNSAGISSLTLDADGNLPAVRCELKPYFKAVIPAKWSQEKRKEALEELDKHGAGDLAKRCITVMFPRSEERECDALMAKLEELGYAYDFSFDIPWQTLTSWLRETVRAGDMPDLEKIGGRVGQVVTMKQAEDQ